MINFLCVITLTELIICPSFIELATGLMATAPTKQTIIDHFRNGRKGTGKWLLVSARNEEKRDPRVLTLWDAVGHEKAAVLTAVKDWTKKGKMPAAGLIVDRASGLRVFKASAEESHGSGCTYMAIGGGRPGATVVATYFDGAGGVPTPSGPRKRIKSFKAAAKQEMDDSVIKGVTPVATDDGVSSVERTNALSTR